MLEIPVDRVERNPNQPRTSFDEEQLGELAASIAVHGILQPIVVRALADGGYQLIAGERRLRAARLAGLETVPAIERDTDERRDVARAGAHREHPAREPERDRDRARLSRADRSVRAHPRSGRPAGGQEPGRHQQLPPPARPAPTRRARRSWTAGSPRGTAARWRPSPSPSCSGPSWRSCWSAGYRFGRPRSSCAASARSSRPGSGAASVPTCQDLEAQLRGVLATKVGIVRTRRGGRLVIDFYSDEELDRLYSIITRGAAGSDERDASARRRNLTTT